MAYPGWLVFAGTEIANVARTVAYARHALPSMVVVDTYDSDDLGLLLGDGSYSSPAQDDAPWYSPYDPDSSDFFGFYPLTVQGIDDGTAEVTVTQLTGDGGVVSRPRQATRSVRVSGLVLGRTEGAIQSGKRWLKGVLSGADCASGDCTGSEMCYLSYLPGWCDFSGYPEIPLDVPNVGLDPAWDALGGSYVSYEPDALEIGSGAGSGARRYLTDLIPGQPYRIALDVLSSSSAVTLSVDGVASIRVLATAEGEVRTLGQNGAYVLDFVATHTTHTFTLAQESVGVTSLLSMSVRRTPNESTRARLTFPATGKTEPVSWQPQAMPVSTTYRGVLGESDAFGDYLALEYQTTSGTLINVTTAHTLTRRFRGFTAGRRYVLRAAVSAHTTVDVTLSFNGADPITQEVTATAPTWIEQAFVATGYSEDVTIGFGETTSTVSGSPARIRLSYLRIDEEDTTVPLGETDLTEEALRTLHQVSVISPLRVTQGFALSSGAMERVEFTVVSHPYAYSPLVEVPPAVDAAQAVLPDTACVLGEPVRHNLLTNPSFEVSANDWTATNASIIRQVDASALSGTFVGRLTVTGSPASALLATAAITVVASAAYTFSAYVRVNQAAEITLQMGASTAFTDIRNTKVLRLEPSSTLQRIEITSTFPGTTAAARIQVRDPDGTSPNGTILYLDAAQFEPGVYATPRFDGDSPGGAWDGALNASTSTWTKSSAPLIVDPDCTPIPPPPRAPLVLDDCIDQPDVWRRYYVQVPASDMPAWSASTPVVTLATGDDEVRQVRIRFSANPFSVSVDEINPCDYCGEFVVSYIPPNSELTINGILEQATIDVANTGTQTAQNLLYGTDGAPITWPTLSCETAYVMTVDVAPTIDDLVVRLALARRE